MDWIEAEPTRMKIPFIFWGFLRIWLVLRSQLSRSNPASTLLVAISGKTPSFPCKNNLFALANEAIGNFFGKKLASPQLNCGQTPQAGVAKAALG